MAPSVLQFWRNAVRNSMQENGTDDCESVDTSSQDLVYKIAINTLIFFTVSGISSVVDFKEFQKSFRRPPIYAGAAFQFLLMPLIGFITVTIFPLGPFEAVALLILCASPGGSFSNWWCNLFNADLALSVSMTSLSTIASIGMLPLNVLIYISLAFERTNDFEGDEVEVDLADLGLTLGVVITAIIVGLNAGARYPQHQQKFNIVGNVAGLASIILGVVASSDTCDGVPPWQQPIYPLWVATAFPLIVALIGTLILGGLLKLKKPQRVAISLETAYQNTGIALAYTVTQGDEGRLAAGVPVIYGGYEAGFFFIFMVASWKLNWTFAPAKDKILKVMFENYQPGSENHKRLHPEEYDEGKVKEDSPEDEEKQDVESDEISDKKDLNAPPLMEVKVEEETALQAKKDEPEMSVSL